VGLWQTYHPRLALQDAAAALGKNRYDVIAITKNLPDEFDSMSKEEALSEENPEYAGFIEYAKDNPDVVDLAFSMTGKIKAQGKHAGGLIISNVPIKDYIPLTKCGDTDNRQWTSAWTEGMADTQLSAFGFIKFDILGLLNLSYIWNCINLVKETRNIDVKFVDMDPREDRAGWMTLPNGKRQKIRLNDPATLKAADNILLDSIFQFDTNFQQSIVQKGGVKSFMDLVIYTSLGRPGPLPMIDVYIKNRDAGDKWKEGVHEILQDILMETSGVLCFQENLLRTWTELCGFTMPEAEKAQKAVKKKKIEILNLIKPKVINGAARHIGMNKAKQLWDTMISFGRYCFNMSHAVAYIVISYRCLWLKTHFPAEWWAAVLSECPSKRFVKFIGSARAEGIEFGSLDVNRLTVNFTVKDGKVLPGLTSVKQLGGKMAATLVQKIKGTKFESFDHFAEVCGSSKTISERLIKLGGFDNLYSNRKALWIWWLFSYGNGTDCTQLRKEIRFAYVWDMKDVLTERERQAVEYRRQYPKRTAIPKRILNWIPSTPIEKPRPYKKDPCISKEQLRMANKLKLDFDQVVTLFPKDFSYREKLGFEKEYLRYYWSPPLGMYHYNKKNLIEDAKKFGTLDAIIEEIDSRQGTRGEYLVLMVTDGINTARVNVWGDEILSNDENIFQPGIGIRMRVRYQEKWNSFSVRSGSIIMPLEPIEE